MKFSSQTNTIRHTSLHACFIYLFYSFSWSNSIFVRIRFWLAISFSSCCVKQHSNKRLLRLCTCVYLLCIHAMMVIYVWAKLLNASHIYNVFSVLFLSCLALHEQSAAMYFSFFCPSLSINHGNTVFFTQQNPHSRIQNEHILATRDIWLTFGISVFQRR